MGRRGEEQEGAREVRGRRCSGSPPHLLAHLPYRGMRREMPQPQTPMTQDTSLPTQGPAPYLLLHVAAHAAPGGLLPDTNTSTHTHTPKRTCCST